MKRNNKFGLALVALSLMAFGSSPAYARHHWGYDGAAEQQNVSTLTTEQQATAQKIHHDFYAQTHALHQQLLSKRYEYKSLLTAQTPDNARIEAVGKEVASLRQSLDEHRVKRDIALAQAGVHHDYGNHGNYNGCGGNGYHRGGHMGGHW